MGITFWLKFRSYRKKDESWDQPVYPSSFALAKAASSAVWSCYQENPVEFKGYSLYDPGAYSEPPLSGKIMWRVTQQPWSEPEDEKEREALEKVKKQMELLKERMSKK